MTRETANTMLELPVAVRDHTQGPASALITLVEYGDYECSRCGQAHAVVRETRQRLGDRMRFVFRHFAMTQLHRHAQHAAEAAEAAGAQNKFWEMHDTLFTHQETLENGYLVEYADALGLDTTRFLRDMAGHVHAERVREDLKGGMRSGVDGTPTFFINGVRHDGPWDVERLLAAVEGAAASREEDASLSRSREE
jgi:protein-disulfide isomerase